MSKHIKPKAKSKLKTKNEIVCDGCNHKEEYSYLVCNGKKYCTKCIYKMLSSYEALPDDGTVIGAQLSYALSNANKTKIKKFFGDKAEKIS